MWQPAAISPRSKQAKQQPDVGPILGARLTPPNKLSFHARWSRDKTTQARIEYEEIDLLRRGMKGID
jgi:hypothetical protein